MNSSHASRLLINSQLNSDLLHCEREKVKGINIRMATLLQKSGVKERMSPTDSRNVMLLTMMSKLTMALAMGIVATVVLLISR